MFLTRAFATIYNMPRTARPPPIMAPTAGIAVGIPPALEAELEAAEAAEEVLLATPEAALLIFEVALAPTPAAEDIAEDN